MVIYKIKASDLQVYSISKNSCKKSKRKFPEAILAAQLFKSHDNLNLITDEKNPKFLISSFEKNKPIGKRIAILPNEKKLDKSYSLFSPKLKIHDENSSTHWDVIYQNPSGKMAYAYTLEKDEKSRKQKYKKVEKFDEKISKLKCDLVKNLTSDKMALPMLILLETKMRIGNEIYYKYDGHKGLTTMKKSDIKISEDKITFDFIAKDGIPMNITKKFDEKIIREMKKLLKTKKQNDFIFTKNSHPMKDTDFEKTFERYCGEKFYPHIVRSHFATKESEKFLKENPNPTKKEIKDFYNYLANELGHKKFSKKDNQWKDSYQVTLHHYVSPKIVKKISNKLKN